MRLSHRDLKALLAGLPSLYGHTSLRTVPQKILLLISTLVPCLAATYDEWDVDREGHVLGYRVVQRPVIPDMDAKLPVLPTLIHTHPLFPTLQQRVTQPLKISDFATKQQFARTAVYNEVYRHVDVQHQMVWFLPGQKSPHICVVISRQGRDFSERDRQILTLLSPHLRQAHTNALALTGTRENSPRDSLLEQHAWEMIHLDANGRAQWLSERAVEWLKTYFPDARWTRALPENLTRWVQRQAWSARPDESELSPRRPLEVQGAAGRLTVTLVGSREGNGLLMLSETRIVSAPTGILLSQPLTRREQEVFRWICEGKTNPEIAMILGISRRTVDKHIEHVLEKLGLENRFQAQRLGWEMRTT